MKRNDLLILVILLAVSLSALLGLYLLFWNTGDTVVVTVDGEERYRLPLDKNTEVWIEGHGGGQNLLVIEDGKAYLREASCPDLVCVHTGAANELRSVVCAPNRVVVSIEKSK